MLRVKEDTNTSDKREARRPRRERNIRSSSLSTLEQFQHLGPPRFTSRAGSEIAESWYSAIECLLERLSFSFEEIITLVAFTFRNLAYT